LAAVVSLAALSILFSVYARRSRTAVIGTYLTVLAYLFLSSLIVALVLEVLPKETGLRDLPDWVLLRTNPPVTVASLVHAQAWATATGRCSGKSCTRGGPPGGIPSANSSSSCWRSPHWRCPCTSAWGS